MQYKIFHKNQQAMLIKLLWNFFYKNMAKLTKFSLNDFKNLPK